MQSKTIITFWQRGLPGLLCIGCGLVLCCVFRHSSPPPEALRRLVFPVALGLMMGGIPLLNSYVYQRSWQAMRPQLVGVATLLAAALAWQASGWLMAQ